MHVGEARVDIGQDEHVSPNILTEGQRLVDGLVPEEGVEPTLPIRERDFESRASASSATPAWVETTEYLNRPSE